MPSISPILMKIILFYSCILKGNGEITQGYTWYTQTFNFWSRCMTVNGQTSYHCSVYKILINLFVWAMIRYCTSTKWVYVSNNGINHFSFKIQWCGLPGRGRAPQLQLLLLMGLASNMGLVLRTPWWFLKIAEYFCMVIALLIPNRFWWGYRDAFN